MNNLDNILDTYIEDKNLDKFLTTIGWYFKDDLQTIKDVTYYTLEYLNDKGLLNLSLYNAIKDRLDKLPEDHNSYFLLETMLGYINKYDL